MEPNNGSQADKSFAPPSPSSPVKKASSMGNALSKDRSVSGTSTSIYKKYAQEVQRVKQERHERLQPLNKTIDQCDDLDMVDDIKNELASLLEKAGCSDTLSWDQVLRSDEFNKKMEFLMQHEESGFYTIQYGADGEYEGDIWLGMRHGRGKLLFRAETYEGEFKWDKRDGRGSAILADGSQIKGDWARDKPDGCVTVLDVNGKITYEGEFKEGKRYGLGRQIFESGDGYDGNWKSGRLHGRGVYCFANGTRIHGTWKEGSYDGVCIFHYPDGSMSRRTYDHGILVSTQDYEHASQRFGSTLTREGMQKHTTDSDFPTDLFMLKGAASAIVAGPE